MKIEALDRLNCGAAVSTNSAHCSILHFQTQDDSLSMLAS
jgi:hypothetical protein